MCEVCNHVVKLESKKNISFPNLPLRKSVFSSSKEVNGPFSARNIVPEKQRPKEVSRFDAQVLNKVEDSWFEQPKLDMSKMPSLIKPIVHPQARENITEDAPVQTGSQYSKTSDEANVSSPSKINKDLDPLTFSQVCSISKEEEPRKEPSTVRNSAEIVEEDPSTARQSFEVKQTNRELQGKDQPLSLDLTDKPSQDLTITQSMTQKSHEKPNLPLKARLTSSSGQRYPEASETDGESESNASANNSSYRLTPPRIKTESPKHDSSPNKVKKASPGVNLARVSEDQHQKPIILPPLPSYTKTYGPFKTEHSENSGLEKTKKLHIGLTHHNDSSYHSYLSNTSQNYMRSKLSKATDKKVDRYDITEKLKLQIDRRKEKESTARSQSDHSRAIKEEPLGTTTIDRKYNQQGTREQSTPDAYLDTSIDYLNQSMQTADKRHTEAGNQNATVVIESMQEVLQRAQGYHMPRQQPLQNYDEEFLLSKIRGFKPNLGSLGNRAPNTHKGRTQAQGIDHMNRPDSSEHIKRERDPDFGKTQNTLNQIYDHLNQRKNKVADNSHEDQQPSTSQQNQPAAQFQPDERHPRHHSRHPHRSKLHQQQQEPLPQHKPYELHQLYKHHRDNTAPPQRETRPLESNSDKTKLREEKKRIEKMLDEQVTS